MEFDKPLTYNPMNLGGKLDFKDIDGLQRFSDVERERWRPIFSAVAGGANGASSGLTVSAREAMAFVDQLTNLVSTLAGIISNHASSGRLIDQKANPFFPARQAVQNHLDQMSQGRPFPPAESEVGAKVLEIGQSNPKDAVAYLALNWPNFANLGQIGSKGFDLRELIMATRFLPTKSKENDAAGLFSGIQKLRSDFSEELSSFDQKAKDFTQWSDQYKLDSAERAGQQAKEFASLVRSSEGILSSFIDRCEMKWSQLQDTYNTELALRAPITYWGTQATSNRKKYVASVAIFCGIVCASLYLFVCEGIPYLKSYSGDKGASALVHVLPLLIPAFIGVWVLKILSRLMSGFLQRYEDAEERKVMVMTFLALMNDEQDGGKKITDQDRILILHALFRPSSVSPTDDAPPVHWFDLLLNRGKS